MPVIENNNPVAGAVRRINQLSGAGAPAANLGAGTVKIGDLYVNTTNGSLYSVTATNGTTTVTWSLVATQT